ncbi:protein ACTIVITY OF BC1 COMPLEX KINASE 8, chloroplastic isoform X2 [Prosopis cineraria]|uniref:protein ACTIVITY OF BC1 COMPLEX KINASE 8, chloroplastic isoform X2 n=1 Tax=Prosopis cineraria TaxID=364024 RepID=UPI00241016E2|nr:protein ACTIVITY OF BC1 COMPLEX KINASE 8, chloroplastic isoform X2 [Prosopis cineraria]
MALSTLPLPELHFLSSQITPRRRLTVSRFYTVKSVSGHTGCSVAIRTQIRAVKQEVALIEEKEKELVKRVNDIEWSGNGASGTSGSNHGTNGSTKGYVNGSLGVVESENGSNYGSLVKYVNGNGAAAEILEDVEASKLKEDGRKRRIEEIGKEDAWFKKSGENQVEVAAAPGGRWSRFKTYSTIQRTLEIWGFVVTFIFKAWWNNRKFSYKGGMTEEKKTLRRKALAKWLKESILRLGPTFIKIGQQFSTRVDILPQEYVDQLSELQVIAEYLQKVDPKSDGAKRDWVAIYDECASVLYQEIDYTKEATNAELFASNFKNMDYVKIPIIFWDYTTPQVLTMEYVPGIKINKIQALDQLGVDRKRLGRYAVESYLEQILSHGFFHADPHPGNIAVDDVNGGRLIFYDFGMMGSISPNIREGLLEAFYGVYEKNPDKVLQSMIQMGVLVPTGDMTAVRRTAQFFLNSFEERLAAQRRERETATAELGFKKPLSKEEKMMKKKERLAAIGEDLLSIAADQPFRFPATFTFVVRAFSVLDGIGKGLDPRFDITEIAKPYALELLRFREAGVEVILKDFRKRWDKQSRAFYNLFRQADRVEKLADIIQRLEQGDLKLRVRALESERAFQRVATVQKTIGNGVAAGSFINLATVLYLGSIRVPAIIAYALCAFFSFQVLIGIVKVKKLDEREQLITGTS